MLYLSKTSRESACILRCWVLLGWSFDGYDALRLGDFYRYNFVCTGVVLQVRWINMILFWTQKRVQGTISTCLAAGEAMEDFCKQELSAPIGI